MDKGKITIVTAFFPLKREEWKKFERPNNKYLEYFEFWARIQNDMIIYTDAETSKYVEKIRKEQYNRDNTKIIVIEDWKKIDEECYIKIKNVMKNNLAVNFKMYSTFPEAWNADYNYMTNMKSWFIQDVVNKNLASGMIAWVDFGFNHGGEYYVDSEDFNFEWQYNFEKDKITLFTINDIDNLPVFEICRRMNSYIQGNVMVAPDYLWIEFWKLVRKNILALASVGLADDDQTITLMAYNEEKEKFKILKTEKWFSMLQQYGNKNFKIKEEEKKKFVKLRKIKQKIKYVKNLKKYLKFWYRVLKNEEMKG